VPVARRAETKPEAIQVPVKATGVSNSMVITCPKCKKDFGRPLNMLDFSKGQAQLVNVCPYCNYILGSSPDEDAEHTRVILPDKTEIEQK
jgi:DNA-directed RNA polymerase subunit RPC12/RpoP